MPPDDRFNSPTSSLSGSHLTLTFRRLKESIVPRPDYQVQVSNDLVTWLDNTSAGSSHTTETAAVSLNAETELVTVHDSTLLHPTARLGSLKRFVSASPSC